MALIQLNINRLGQGWFILWEEAVLGGSLGVYQAAEVPGRWMEGGMEGCRTELVDSCRHPGTAGMAPPPAQPFGTAPRHLLAGCREMGLKIGKLGLSGQRERQAGCHISRCRKQPDIQLPGVAYPPAPLSCGSILIKTPQFCPRVMGPSLAPGQTLPRAVEPGWFSTRILFPAAQRAILAGV